VSLLRIILYSYATATLFVALRLGWHVVFKLDRYDWRYDKGDIWLEFGLSVLLWPLVVIEKPRDLLDPTNLFSKPYGLATRARLRDNPPRCGNVIRYRQADGFTTAFGEFLFRAEAVERVLIDRIRELPHRENEDDGAILNWVRHRDRGLSEPTDVPVAWRFRFAADELIREGEGKVRCLKCEETFPTGALIPRDDHGRPGWNMNELLCQRGHELLIVNKMHAMF